jgi:hypothetical protein
MQLSPSFSGIYETAVTELCMEIWTNRGPSHRRTRRWRAARMRENRPDAIDKLMVPRQWHLPDEQHLSEESS